MPVETIHVERGRNHEFDWIRDHIDTGETPMDHFAFRQNGSTFIITCRDIKRSVRDALILNIVASGYVISPQSSVAFHNQDFFL